VSLRSTFSDSLNMLHLYKMVRTTQKYLSVPTSILNFCWMLPKNEM
jgi:hypothetical protein